MTDSRKVLVAISRFHESSPDAFARLRSAGCEVVKNDRRPAADRGRADRAAAGRVRDHRGRRALHRAGVRSGAGAARRRPLRRRLRPGRRRRRDPPRRRGGHGVRHQPRERRRLRLRADDRRSRSRSCRTTPRVAGGGWGCSFHPGALGPLLGIVGLGRIGQAMARRCRAFEMRVLAADPVADQAYARGARHRAGRRSTTLLREADFVSMHTPLAPETRQSDRSARARADEAAAPS